MSTADLKAANARVIYSLNFPTRRAVAGAGCRRTAQRAARSRQRAEGPGRARQGRRRCSRSNPAGLADPKDFLKNAQKTVANGLSKDAALKALTLNAATLAGAADRLGSLDRGKIANVIVTEGDLFDEKTTIKHVFVNGRPVKLN